MYSRIIYFVGRILHFSTQAAIISIHSFQTHMFFPSSWFLWSGTVALALLSDFTIKYARRWLDHMQITNVFVFFLNARFSTTFIAFDFYKFEFNCRLFIIYLWKSEKLVLKRKTGFSISKWIRFNNSILLFRSHTSKYAKA